MEWLSENWVFLLVVIGMIAMHLFGHGGHGGHRGHRGPGRRDDQADPGPRDERLRGGHRH